MKTVEPYLIKIDSLYPPDTVDIKYVFTVELFGFVALSACSTKNADINIDTLTSIKSTHEDPVP